MTSDFLKISPQITCLPVIHGSGDFAVEVRRVMLSQEFDCLAVPLPASFQSDVERAIEFLPSVTTVLQEEPTNFSSEPWSPDQDEADDDSKTCSYVPIDPCQPVIAALRIAKQEHIPRAFIDLETAHWQPLGAVLPDPYAVKQVSADKFAAAVLPALGRLPEGQAIDRVRTMASRLRDLELQYRSILFVCSVIDWPWVREAYVEQHASDVADDDVEATSIFAVDPLTLTFILGELPYITNLSERARAELDDDENLSIDGPKEMVLASRDRYQAELKSSARKITPKLLASFFQYVRNLALIERRMTPNLYSMIVAAQQIFGDRFATHVAKTAREYSYTQRLPFSSLSMGIDKARLPDGDQVEMKSRLPGHPISWKTCSLRPPPPKPLQQRWQVRWNPHSQCSWPPEDNSIERFRTHVKDTALALLGTDLARSEKFTASLKDGLDIRETLRNWHTGDLYVKVFPPTRGSLDCVVMLFDSPADPREYPWRVTWHAEHHDESTLSLFATDFHQQMVGPGIGLATYGGAMFLFPPRPIPDIWRDPRFDFADTLEERLIAAGCHHSKEKHVAVLSDAPPGAGFRRLARTYQRKLVHIPLSRFSRETVEQLRMFHVLNGQQVRSYAAHFIRKA